MNMDQLQSELEQRFSLDELLQLTQQGLGVSPDAVGGTLGKGSYVRALTQFCSRNGTSQALLDVVVRAKPGASDELVAAAHVGLGSVGLDLGPTFEGFNVQEELGVGSSGRCYLVVADTDASRHRLKVFNAQAVDDVAGMARFLAFSRHVARVCSSGLVVGAHFGHPFTLEPWFEGTSLAATIARIGSLSFGEAVATLRPALVALRDLHDKGLVHGNIKPENILVASGEKGSGSARLIDAGLHLTRGRAGMHGRVNLLGIPNPHTIAPEVLSGHPVTPASDVYSVGVILFELLTGSFPFAGSSAMSLAVAHMSQEAPPASDLVPKGAISSEVDDLIARLLSKQAEDRPVDAGKLIELLDSLQLRKSQRPPPPRDEVDQLLQAFKQEPTSTITALKLEAIADGESSAREVALAFRDAATQLDPEDRAQRETMLDLAFRSARLFRDCDDKEQAEAVYQGILSIDPDNLVATSALEDLRQSLGKFDALIELWLNQHESAGTLEAKAQCMAKVGRLYERELNDPGQALVAFCQALVSSPSTTQYAAAVERVAGADSAAWREATDACSEGLQHITEPERRTALLLQLGEWYASRLLRTDVAAQCFQAALQVDPNSHRALDGLANVYRSSQQWPELAQLYVRRAQTSVASKNRGFLVQAAALLATRLNDPDRAKQLLEEVLQTDPLHPEAMEALRSLYQETGDVQGQTRLLEQQLQHTNGPERVVLLCRLARLADQAQGDPTRALELYEQALRLAPDHLEALHGLEIIQERTGKFRDLLSTLERSLTSSATPRQKTRVLARIAQLQEQEFLDHAQAIAALESLLTIDPKNSGALSDLERLRRDEQNWPELAALYLIHADTVADPNQKAALLVESANVQRKQLNDPNKAIETFEKALALKPEDADALAGLAELRQASGDAEEALKAIQLLARSAPTPEAQAQQHVRAAQLLASRKELAAAVEQYQLALEAVPFHPQASAELRKTYLELGDPERAISLLYDMVEPMPVGTERSKLTAELARLLLEHTDDWEVAAETAAQAFEWNDTSVDALFVLATVTFASEQFQEALAYTTRLLPHIGALPHKDAIAVLSQHVESHVRLGQSEGAFAAAQQLRALAPEEVAPLRRLGDLMMAHDQFEQAEQLYKSLLDGMPESQRFEKAELSYLYADAMARSGRLDEAIPLLVEAVDMSPTAISALNALARAYADKENFKDFVEVKSRVLDLTNGDERTNLLVELGELVAQKLGDRERAAHYLVSALGSRPNDRKILTRLMQLYTEDKDWAKLVDVVLKLADFVDDDKQKAKYLMTAGMVSARELNDSATAVTCFERVLEHDPSLDKALIEGLALLDKTADHERAEDLLKARMKAATAEKDVPRLRDTFVRLGELYKSHLNRVKDAIEAFEAANTIDSTDKSVWNALSELYATDSHLYFEKGRALFTNVLLQDPYRPEAYKALRKVYTDAKNADGAWCLCQALAVLKLAQPDEERFYRRMRSDDPAYAQAVLTRGDYRKLVEHADVDHNLSEVFAAIEPAIIRSRGYEFHELGYDPNFAVDLARHPHPIGQTLHYAAGVLGMDPPPAFDNTNDPGGLAFLDTKVPSISMGLGVLSPEIHPQALAFLAGRHLTYYRAGLFLRQLIGTGTGLKTWLFAAIKLISPIFPITADLEGPVSEHLAILRDLLPPHAKDDLARAVSKLLQTSNALDLKTWVNAIDYTADRIGFVLAHDLETAVEVVRSTEEDEALVRDRIKQLVLYSISPQYLELRKHLKIDLN
jgi:tetratricopeptide (TPR) repeat protein